MTVPGGAKISFLGRAMLTLPAGTLVAVPGTGSLDAARRSNLTSTTVRLLCAAAMAVAAVVVWAYSVVSIRALADPMPGDALNATGGTAFML